MLKSLMVWITTNCGKFVKGKPDCFTYLLRNLHADQEVTDQKYNNKLVQYWERSMSRLYVIILLI